MEKEKILNWVRNIAIVTAIIFVILGISNISSNKNLNKTPSNLATTTTVVKEQPNSTTTKKTSAKIEPCKPGNTDFDCYNDFYKNLVKTKGVKEAFKFLKEDFKINSYVVAQCHPITHVIGHAAVSLYPDVADAFNHGDPYCWSGFYHGVMEEISEKIGAKGIEKELNNICAKIPGKERYSFDYYNCVHGLGHGVMAVNGDELFKSLDVCLLLDGSWEKESCYGGVFMENVIIDNKGDYTKYLKPNDPMYPCNAVDVKYKTSCYLMQTSYALKVTSYNFEKVFELCRNADRGFENICYQSLGRDASGSSSSNTEVTKQRCELGKTYDERFNCVVGAVKDFVSYFHSDVQAKNLCEVISFDMKDGCLAVVSSYYQTF